jgi:hypothetical protein
MMRAAILAVAILALAAPAASAEPLVIQGTDGPDHIRIDALTPVSGTYTVNGVQQPFAAATSVRIDGRDGADNIVIVNAPGLFAPPEGIRISGGGDGESSDFFLNRPASSTLYRFGTSPVHENDPGGTTGSFDHDVDGAGTSTLTHALGPVTQKVVLDGVERSSDELFEDSFTYRATEGSDDLRLFASQYYHIANTATIGLGAEQITVRGKKTLTVDSKSSGATPDRVEMNGAYAQKGRVIVDDGAAVPEDEVVLTETWGTDANTEVDLQVRAGSLAWPDHGFEHFQGRSVAIEAGRMVPGATSYDGRFEVDADNVEIHTDGDVRVWSDVPLNVGGASAALSGIRSTGGSVHLGTFSDPIAVAAGEQVAGRDVTLSSDDVDLVGEVSASGTATLRPAQSGQLFNLGGAPTDPRDEPYTYTLTAADLERVRAGTIELGDERVSTFWVTAPVSAAGSAALRLVSQYDFGGFNGAAIDAAELQFVSHHTAARNWAIGPTSVSNPSGGGPIAYTRATKVSVRAGSGADRIAVTPSATTAFTIDGNGPTTAPGDVLTYASGGRPVQGDRTPPSGSMRSHGFQAVAFDGIEEVSILP